MAVIIFLADRPKDAARSATIDHSITRCRKVKNAMPFIPVPDTAEVVISYSDVGELAQNTLYFTQAGGWTTGALLTLAEAIDGWVEGSLLPLLSSSLALTTIVATDIENEFGAQAGVSSTAVGGVGTEQAPNAIAACISFRTGTRGRSFRGRNYIPGIPNAAIDVNILNGTFLLDVQAAYETLLPGGGVFPGGVPLWTVVSRYSGVDGITGKPIPRVAGITSQITEVRFTDNVVDTQRRRGPGRGR